MYQEDIYENYKSERYIHYRMIPTGNYEMIERLVSGEKRSVPIPVMEKKKVDFDDIKNLNLDAFGTDVRTCADDFQLVHNYFFDFWGAVLGGNAVLAYLHLKRYCFGNKDFCFPDLKTITAKMGKSRNTVIAAIDTLEQFGFVSKIYRLDQERKNVASSSFFKVRRYIPLLSKEYYQLLPTELQEEHDKFIEHTKAVMIETQEKPTLLFEKMLENAPVIKAKSRKLVDKEMLKNGNINGFIVSQVSDEKLENSQILLQKISELISKPSFDVWFSKTFLLLDKNQDSLLIVCESDFIQERIEQHYKKTITDIAQSTFQLNLIAITCITYETYIQEHHTLVPL